ncbi:DUF4194 domain-containing protein [Aeoliella sp. ICT_H6.2]|uniref:DUF4194 domain-containing protein n=1 Tax=Aeoliella straminimaris TaxID=2954799 RepID=A0A9X2FJY2_9BACT|nr:DUF4194 domain-containing protein [Aeoliella straminimaris]MCO6048061.1 DUF4194 domain-containing protein [Aeoliella straminimaris]
MSIESTELNDLPEFDELGVPAVRLLQGVLYADDILAWDTLLARESDLVTYFAKIGLMLIVDRNEGMAYLKQLDDDHRTGGYERLPRLFRRTSLGYAATLLCVLLRDEYRRFEDEDLDNERCVVDVNALLEEWKQFFPYEQDEVRLRKQLLASLASMEKMKFVRKFGGTSDAWEVCRLLKARLPLEELESLRDRLLAAAE